jgi:hypothetical protein
VGGHAEGLSDDVSRHPGDAALRIDHEGDSRTLVARHFAVDEYVLNFLTTAKSEGLHAVARLPPPDREMPAKSRRVQDHPGGL